VSLLCADAFHVADLSIARANSDSEHDDLARVIWIASFIRLHLRGCEIHVFLSLSLSLSLSLCFYLFASTRARIRPASTLSKDARDRMRTVADRNRRLSAPELLSAPDNGTATKLRVQCERENRISRQISIATYIE